MTFLVSMGSFCVLLCALASVAAAAQNASEGCSAVKRARDFVFFPQDEPTTDEALARRMLHHMPRFNAQVADGVSDECAREVAIYLEDLSSLRLWALKMYDSTAKVPSGLLNGNVNQLGDFEQCLSVSGGGGGGAGRVRGRYCLAAVQLTLRPNASATVAAIHRLMHSNYAFRSELDDPGHRVPKFSSVNWGVCVPAACSARDVEAALRSYLSGALEGSHVELGVRVQPQACQVRGAGALPWGTLLAGSFCAAIVITVVTATIYDSYVEGKKNEYVVAFSLAHNTKKMAEAPYARDDIRCVHGIRFLNSIMLIISHKSMAIMFIPFYNRTAMSFEIGKQWTVMSRAASLYTDPFIMFSGLLTTYSILRRLDRHGSISLPKEYLSRLIRMIPSFAALILFCTWLMPLMGSGPFWNQVVNSHADLCKQYWWRNLLFIHNYFGFENMCLTHTHHVGIDTQLFFATPPAVLLLWRWPRRTARALVALAALSTLARYLVTYSMGLSNFVFFGTSVKQLFETADYMYILPAHRATVYIMGILLGYLLHTSKNTLLSKAQLRVGWAVSTALLLVSFVGPAGMGTLHYEYDATQAACYAAFAPVAWCAFFGWVVFTSQLGHTNLITRWFSWRGFALWTKISYSVYLTQFPVFFYTVGVVKTPQEYSFAGQLFNIPEFGAIIIASLALTLLVEFPSQNFKDIFFRGRSVKVEAPRRLPTPTPQFKDIEQKAVHIVEKFRHVESDKSK